MRLFNKSHLKRYGNTSDEKVQIVNYRLFAMALKEDAVVLPKIPRDLTPRSKKRTLYLDGKAHVCPFHDRKTLPSGFTLEGPAVIQEEVSATLVPPGWNASISDQGTLHLREVR